MTTDLTDLATRDDWRDLLTDTELQLVEHARLGEPLDLRTGDPNRDAFDQVHAWGWGRVVRGPVLEVLLLGARPDWPLHHRGLRLQGALIDPQLNLSFGSVATPFVFEHCVFRHPVDLRGAGLRTVAFAGTRVPALEAGGIDVNGNVFLRSGFIATGEVRLIGATISGDLTCDRASFRGGPSRKAFTADRVDVAGDVCITEGFAHGEVRLHGARVGGSVTCHNGSFENPPGNALTLDGATIAGSVLLTGRFTAKGDVRLTRATVGGDLEYHSGSLDAQGSYGGSSVTIEGSLDLRGASVGLIVDDVAVWPDGWQGDGLTYRDFGGNASVHVARRLAWLSRMDGGIRLGAYAAYRAVIDRHAGTPWYRRPEGYLRTAYREAWDALRTPWPTEDVRPNPYSSLAAVYQGRGDTVGARRVLIARARGLTGAMRPWWRRWPHRVWGLVSSYGHRPWRAVIALILLIVISTAVFADARANDAMDLLGDPDTNPQVAFNPWIYAMDLAIPLVDLRQANDYQPQESRAQWWMWATIALGWFLSLAFVAAVTGLFKPDA